MHNFQRNSLRAAVDTLSSPLFQQILTHFITVKFTLLVFDTTDLSIFHQLRIKTYQLLANARDRHEPTQTTQPYPDVLHAAVQGRGQPTVAAATVIKPRRTVAG